jgi:SsrA-binding protein
MSKQADIASNKKARHDFDIVETYETGIVLRGTEVKSVRSGKMNLRDAFARVEKGEVLLHGCDIQPYENASFTQHDAKRPRKLLLHKKEILKLSALTHEKGYTLVALRAYWSGQRVKIELGVAKGKVTGDRREDLKTRVETREAERAVANFNRR